MKLTSIKKKINLEFDEDELTDLVKFVKEVELGRLVNIPSRVHAICTALSGVLNDKQEEKKV